MSLLMFDETARACMRAYIDIDTTIYVSMGTVKTIQFVCATFHDA